MSSQGKAAGGETVGRVMGGGGGDGDAACEDKGSLPCATHLVQI